MRVAPEWVPWVRGMRDPGGHSSAAPSGPGILLKLLSELPEGGSVVGAHWFGSGIPSGGGEEHVRGTPPKGI